MRLDLGVGTVAECGLEPAFADLNLSESILRDITQMLFEHPERSRANSSNSSNSSSNSSNNSSNSSGNRNRSGAGGSRRGQTMSEMKEDNDKNDDDAPILVKFVYKECHKPKREEKQEFVHIIDAMSSNALNNIWVLQEFMYRMKLLLAWPNVRVAIRFSVSEMYEMFLETGMIDCNETNFRNAWYHLDFIHEGEGSDIFVLDTVRTASLSDYVIVLEKVHARRVLELLVRSKFCLNL